MPVYCNAIAENEGKLFPKCGSKEIAGARSNTSAQSGAGDDYVLVNDYGWNITANSLQDIGFSLYIVVPAFQPIITSAFNVMNNRDPIKELKIFVVDSISGRGQITGVYTATKGNLVNAGLTHEHSSKSGGMINLSFVFDSIHHDNKVTNTLGEVKASDLGG